MRRNRLVVAAVGGLTLLSVGGGAMAAKDGGDHKRAHSVRAPLMDQAGKQAGEARVVTSHGDTWVQIRAHGLTPGWHGAHLHTVGRCEGDFTSAGGHLNPSGGTHADHAGDLPQLLVRQDGSAVLETLTDRVSARMLLDHDGTSIVIHSGADNYANIPARYNGGPDAETKKAGDSGSRQTCGVFMRE